MLEQAPFIDEFVRDVRDEGFTDAVLLGMGGSSLGPEVIRRSYGDLPDGLRLQVLDSTHPDAVLAVQESIDVEKTIFIVSSKSGGTIETLSHYRHFKTMAGPHQFVVVTDPDSPLAEIAREDGLRRTFINPPDIGGRYSVLSYFGLVPAALMGVNIRALLHRCQVAEQMCAHYDSSESNSGLWEGAALGELALQGRDKLTFVVSHPIESFGLWAEQLVAESTGKQGRGIVPVCDEPLGDSPDAYGNDRVFLYRRNFEEPEERLDAFIEKVGAAGHPTFTLPAHGAADLGRIFFLTEFAVAVAGWALEINPFDQPNVQEAKDNTKRVLDSGSIPELEAAGDEQLRALLADANPPHYVAIMGYVPPSDEFDAAVAELRDAIRAATGAATTFGYGPRFLHSTGQLHKGGPPTGRFLQLVNDCKGRRRRPRRRLLVRDADRGTGGGRLGDVARARPTGRAGQARRATPWLPSGSSPRESPGYYRGVSQCRSASWGSARWAATWCIASAATPTTKWSRSTSPRMPSRQPSSTARPARIHWRSWWASWKLPATCGSWSRQATRRRRRSRACSGCCPKAT